MSDYSIKGARAWAEGAQSSVSLVVREAAQILLDLLPEPTLDEIGWDWDTHHMAGAISPQEEEVVMLWFDDDANLVICAESAWRPDELTPTGNRYKLVNVNDRAEQAAHPTVLETEQDFEDAPQGTIVTRRIRTPWTRLNNGEWACGAEGKRKSSADMADYDGWRVLRWGWQL